MNLAGGTLDVAEGVINLSWLRGADGRLYEASSAPADRVTPACTGATRTCTAAGARRPRGVS